MENPLNFLILEDSPLDAELLEHTLKKAGFNFDAITVSNEANYVKMLNDYPADVIFADYNLPGFDGSLAYKLFQEHSPKRIPFIFVSGTIGEEKAVELLKKGATDFVLKNNLGRIPLILQRALDEYEENRKRNLAEEELKRTHRALEVLSQCNELTIRATDEQNLLNSICDILAKTSGYLFTWIGYKQEDVDKHIIPIAYSGFDENYIKGVDVRWDNSIWGNGPGGTVVKTGEPCLVTDLKTYNKFAPWIEHASKYNFQSMVCLPLGSNEPFGILSIYSTEPGAFSSNEITLLKRLAANLAYGINHLRLEKDRQQKQYRLIKEKEKLHFLQEIAFLANETSKIDELFQTTVDKLGVYSHCSLGHVYIISENSSSLEPSNLWFSDKKADHYKKFIDTTMQTTFEKGEGVLGRIMEGKNPVFIENLETHSIFIRSSKGIKCMYGFPVLVNNSVAAVIELFFDDTIEFDEDLWTVANTICPQLGQAYERLKTKYYLVKSKEKYQQLVEQAADAILLFDCKGKILEQNSKAYELLGYDQQEITNIRIEDIIPPEDLKKSPVSFEDLREGKTVTKQRRILHKDGSIFYADISAKMLSDGRNQCILRNITDRILAEKQIKKSLKEKEVLLAEIHHRVKNNLAVISGMIDLQADRMNNQATINLLRDSQFRIRSMALIHEHLYQYETLSNIRLDNYVKELSRTIENTFCLENKRILIQFDTTPVLLTINQAVPCGLLINEILTNAFKHAFKNRTNGVIKISLSNDENNIKLTISDNGIGLPNEMKLINKPLSLGIILIQTLTKQLHAHLKVNNNSGTQYDITFAVVN